MIFKDPTFDLLLLATLVVAILAGYLTQWVFVKHGPLAGCLLLTSWVLLILLVLKGSRLI